MGKSDKKLVSIDWSGAGEDDEPATGIRVAYWTREDGFQLEGPARLRRAVKSWSRVELEEYLLETLAADAEPALVACDFGFGLPWGADREVFGVEGWRQTVDAVAKLYAQFGTARETAEQINRWERFAGHGPYRFDPDRSDFRFYLDHGVAYHRLTEMVVPQALSQWYLGSGATVGFSTITGLAMLSRLLSHRDREGLPFAIHPQEPDAVPGARHVLVESYPALIPLNSYTRTLSDRHTRDARKVLGWLYVMCTQRKLDEVTQVPLERLARLDPNAEKRVQFEGWIAGVL